MRKTVVHLAVRGGLEAELPEHLAAIRKDLRSELGQHEIRAFVRVVNDPFAKFATPTRAFEATLELRGAPEPVPPALARTGELIRALAHLDLSTLLAGEEHVLDEGPDGEVHYQYLMRRRHDWTHADYLTYYREQHGKIGCRTPGKLAYRQFHVDPARSREGAGVAGLGVWSYDSVSELALASVSAFLAASAEIGIEAMRDEERFVDRANSIMFASRALPEA